MAKKQAIANESVASASSTRAAKSKTPRVKAAQHKVVVVEDKAVVIEVLSSEQVITQGASENPREIIAQMAYGLWEAGGRRHGADLEDWLRAENEYRQHPGVSRN